MSIKNILIIGAGWYGCHIGMYLKRLGHKITIFEKNNDIFTGSSGYNQFRLHTGFHYPRSSDTIEETKKNYYRFKMEYKNFINFPKNNIYCIAKRKSLIDSKSYETLMRSHNLKFKKIKLPYIQNIEQAYNCNEGVILNKKLINFYKKNLKKNIYFNKSIKDINKYKNSYDFVIDCTNATMMNKLNKNFNYVLTISLVYKSKKKSTIYPLTIMDGLLPSLYPYADKDNFFTLTHSKYTHIKKFKNFDKLKKFQKTLNKNYIENVRENMENSITFFMMNFKEKLKYHSYFFSYKILPNEGSDKRTTYIKKNGNTISCNSPKITNIFTFEKYLKKIINE